MKLGHRRKGHKAWLVSIDSYLNRHVSSFEALVMMIGAESESEVSTGSAELCTSHRLLYCGLNLETEVAISSYQVENIQEHF